jgi:hypothetical protein
MIIIIIIITTSQISNEIWLEYLHVTVLRRGVGEVRVVVGRDPAC